MNGYFESRTETRFPFLLQKLDFIKRHTNRAFMFVCLSFRKQQKIKMCVDHAQEGPKMDTFFPVKICPQPDRPK